MAEVVFWVQKIQTLMTVAYCFLMSTGMNFEEEDPLAPPEFGTEDEKFHLEAYVADQ